MEFAKWMEANNPRKPYDIRLNPGAKISSGGDFNNSFQATKEAILQSYTPDLQGAEKLTRRILLQYRPDARCTRCEGTGRREDRENWHKHGELGRVCYKCGGSGIEPKMEPVFFRRRVIDYIRQKLNQGKVDEVVQWANKVKAADVEQQPYKPMLMDIVDLIDANNFRQIGKLPH